MWKDLTFFLTIRIPDKPDQKCRLAVFWNKKISNSPTISLEHINTILFATVIYNINIKIQNETFHNVEKRWTGSSIYLCVGYKSSCRHRALIGRRYSFQSVQGLVFSASQYIKSSTLW